MRALIDGHGGARHLGYRVQRDKDVAVLHERCVAEGNWAAAFGIRRWLPDMIHDRMGADRHARTVRRKRQQPVEGAHGLHEIHEDDTVVLARAGMRRIERTAVDRYEVGNFLRPKR